MEHKNNTYNFTCTSVRVALLQLCFQDLSASLIKTYASTENHDDEKYHKFHRPSTSSWPYILIQWLEISTQKSGKTNLHYNWQITKEKKVLSLRWLKSFITLSTNYSILDKTFKVRTRNSTFTTGGICNNLSALLLAFSFSMWSSSSVRNLYLGVRSTATLLLFLLRNILAKSGLVRRFNKIWTPDEKNFGAGSSPSKRDVDYKFKLLPFEESQCS